MILLHDIAIEKSAMVYTGILQNGVFWIQANVICHICLSSEYEDGHWECAARSLGADANNIYMCECYTCDTYDGTSIWVHYFEDPDSEDYICHNCAAYRHPPRPEA